MSILLDGDNDQLALTQSLTIGTGDVVFACWAYFTTTLTNGAVLSLADNATPTAGFLRLFNDTTPQIGGRCDASYTTTYTQSVDTWYWIVYQRASGGAFSVRLFDDTSSSTPVTTLSTTGATTDFTTVDTVVVGRLAGALAAARCEVANVKVHTGVTWSDAECRTESQNYGIQKSGGTDRYCWKLTDIDADTDGINEISGAGPNFTNTSVTTGASSPTQLSPASTTLYFLDSAASGSNFGQLQFGGSAPTTATTATGWTVDTVGSGQYALMAYASERASSVFGGTAQPAGNPDNSLGDCFRSTSTISGDFATGVWTIALPVIAVSAAAGQDGRVRVRLWKSANATGTSPTEITSGAVAGTTVTNLTTGAEQVSTVTTGSITGFSMTNEYLFVQIAWEITGAAT